MTATSRIAWLGAAVALLLAGAAAAEAVEAAASVPEVPERTLRDWWDLGGFIMHGLAVISVLAFGIVLERSWALRTGAVAPRPLVQELGEGWDARRVGVARELCDRHPSSLGRIVRAGIRAAVAGSGNPQEHAAAAGDAEALRLRKNLPLLAALANLATMLGLLGTVLGMIQAFDVIAVVGTSDARVVARGIFQALVTTAAGLSVGIVALSCHALLRRRADSWLTKLEGIATDLFDEGGAIDAAEEAAAAAGLAPAAR